MNSEWTLSTVGSLLKLNYGKPLPAAKRSKTAKYAVYGANGVKTRSDFRLIDKPTIIVGRKGSAGECRLEPGGCWPLDVTYFVTHDPVQTNLEFLYHWLKFSKLQRLATGVKPGINRNDVYRLEIPVPPLPEQKRIVAILDEAFSAIDQAETLTRNAAVNALNLQDQFMSSCLSGSKSSAKNVALQDCCEKITVGHVGSMKSRYVQSGVPFLRSKNVRPFKIDLNELVFIDDEFDSQLKKSILRPGDLVIVRTGEPGTAAVIPDSLHQANCSDLVIIRPSPEALADYLCLIFNSSFGRRLVSGELVGVAQRHFNVSSAKSAVVPLPSISDQRRMVDRCNQNRELTTKLHQVELEKLVKLSLLRQSLLREAFAGRLTGT